MELPGKGKTLRDKNQRGEAWVIRGEQTREDKTFFFEDGGGGKTKLDWLIRKTGLSNISNSSVQAVVSVTEHGPC